MPLTMGGHIRDSHIRDSRADECELLRSVQLKNHPLTRVVFIGDEVVKCS